jgi:hypothetical protein
MTRFVHSVWKSEASEEITSSVVAECFIRVTFKENE